MPTRDGLPGWAVSLIVAGALVGIGAVAYLFLLPSHRVASDSAGPRVESTIPSAAQPATAIAAHPLAKYIELTGFRVTEDAKQKAQVRFLAVNHSAAEMSDLAVEVDMRLPTAKPGDEPALRFSFKLPSLRAYESKELTAPAQTSLRAYELPDWQFLRADFRITSPK